MYRVFADVYSAHNQCHGDVYHDAKELIRDAIHIENDIVDIDDELDYSYIEEFYFRDFSALVDNICKSTEKWIIFINDKVRGQKFAQRLNDLGNETVFISAAQKSDFFVRKQLEELETNQSFSCKVLISTAILDCGINILDEQVRNIVIFETEKTAFMQMLGRVRIHANQKIRLFMKAPTALEIRDRVRYTCKKSIQYINSTYSKRRDTQEMGGNVITGLLCV